MLEPFGAGLVDRGSTYGSDSSLRFDRPLPTEWSSNFVVYLLIVLGPGTPALEHLPARSLASGRPGTRFSRWVFGLQGRQ